MKSKPKPPVATNRIKRKNDIEKHPPLLHHDLVTTIPELLNIFYTKDKNINLYFFCIDVSISSVIKNISPTEYEQQSY